MEVGHGYYGNNKMKPEIWPQHGSWSRIPPISRHAIFICCIFVAASNCMLKSSRWISVFDRSYSRWLACLGAGLPNPFEPHIIARTLLARFLIPTITLITFSYSILLFLLFSC